MPVKEKNPITAGQRFQVVDTFEDITKFSPEKSLCVRLRKNSGRGFKGRISMRHRGGGAHKIYRMVDFKRIKDGGPAKVVGIEKRITVFVGLDAQFLGLEFKRGQPGE